MTDAFRNSSLPHVVIVGGGFGGIAAAKALRKAPVRVTLIDRNAYQTFKPLLYQVAAGALNAGDITYYLRALGAKQKNFRFVLGEFQKVDTDSKVIYLDDNRTMRYDYLIMATGVGANYFGTPGAEEHTLPIYSRDEAITLRDRLFGLLDGHDFNEDGKPFRVVVCGGGPTGVETAGAIAELKKYNFRELFPGMNTDAFEVTLVDMAPVILGPFTEESQEAAKQALLDRGVKIMLKEAVREVEANRIKLQNMDTKEEHWIDANLIVWSSGVGVPKVASQWGLPQGARGRIQVDENLRVEGADGVFAVGDVAVIGERGLPQLAQPAKQGGTHVAKVIKNSLQGVETEPFEYVDLGSMATVGAGFAVAEITKVPPISGRIAWLIWNFIHVVQLQSGRERVATTANLISKYFLFPGKHDLVAGDYNVFSKRARDGVLSASQDLDDAAVAAITKD
ncbi:NAD(P)/FAD-dependent oxidoreductase [Actinobaculum suis]|uniref:NAD(P)/FAD-dependent oxidoreductase n=1 Tax=Actinobaculum suis TaxID=1657 RepID=UPI0008086BAC|nr:NAD(P)/FAD-dependent oxidoreductase [Actinobaculum suis]OCA93667.1 hypothetical protein ACU20_08440 [Actinobaculum suis]OCA94193.1 hypothetical protein ACU21_08665 [Actinobaculum suis]